MDHAPTNAGPYRPAPIAVSAAPLRRPALHSRELLVIAAIVVWTDLTVFDTHGFATGGYGLAALFVGLALLVLLGTRARRASWRVGALVLGLALVAGRTAIDPTVLTTFAGFALAGTLAIALRTPRASVLRVADSAGRTLVALPARVRAAALGVRSLARANVVERIPVLAILVPIVVCLAFVGLFALANPVVADAATFVLDALFSGLRLPGIVRVAIWPLALIAAIALVRPSLSLRVWADRAPAGEASPTRLGIARNTMIGVNLLFFCYLALEASTLFVGHPPDGMTTQIYAHQGALWLTVALALLTVVAGALFHGHMATDPAAKLSRRLALAWAAQGLLVAVGTYWRIAIHIQYSGLSNLRIVGILGTTLVVVGVLFVAMKLRGARTLSWLVSRQLDAFAVAVVLFAVSPTHYLSARVNVARIESGELGPLIHMRAQSAETESAAALLPLLQHPDPRVSATVAVLLGETRTSLEGDLAARRHLREGDALARPVFARLDAAGLPARAEAAGMYSHEAVDALQAIATEE